MTEKHFQCDTGTMAQHLDEQLRNRIIVWRYEFRKPVQEIADLAGCSERTIYKILQLHRDHGEVRNPFARCHGRPCSLQQGDLTYISSILAANPTLYLDKIQLQLFQAWNVEVSLATLSHAIHRLQLTHKQLAKTAVERNELLRATWQAEYGDIPMEYFVWIDESSVDDQTNQRTSGWSSIGRACARHDPILRGQRFSVLPALSMDGIIALDIFEGSVNKEKFLLFLHQQLVRSLTFMLI